MDDRIDYKKINIPMARVYLENKNIVFTGRGFLVRGELSRLARQAGGNVESLVSKRTDLLIVGEKPGSKLRKAKVLGCDIITTEDFKNIMYGNGVVKKTSEEDYSLYNINRSSKGSNLITMMLEDKRVILLVENELIRKRFQEKIKDNNGVVIDINDLEKADLIIYEPKSKNNILIMKARSENIEIMTLGEFNRFLI